MPVSKPRELPDNGGGRWPHTGFRSVRWGDMEVGFTIAPAVDCAPVMLGCRATCATARTTDLCSAAGCAPSIPGPIGRTMLPKPGMPISFRLATPLSTSRRVSALSSTPQRPSKR
jgi:hypothetical protein